MDEIPFKKIESSLQRCRCEATQLVRWNVGRKCSFDAIVEVDGKKLCKRHANAHICNLVLSGEAKLVKQHE